MSINGDFKPMEVDKSPADKSPATSPGKSPGRRKSIMDRMLKSSSLGKSLGKKLSVELGVIKSDEESQKKDEIQFNSS